MTRPINTAYDGHAMPGISERRVLDRADGKLRIVKTQLIDVGRFSDAVQARQEMTRSNETWRFRGSVPLAVAQQWAVECGAGIGSRGWKEYASKQIDKPEFARLRGR